MADRIGSWGPRFPREVTAAFREALALRTPRIWVTPVLIGANALVHVAMAVRGVDPWTPSGADAISWGANYAHLTLGGQWWRLLTSAFVHFGTPHLVLNMMVLWSVGYLVEALVGNVGFLIAYLLAAVVGSIASLSWNPYAVAAGASGAVFGVYGVLLAYLVRARESVPPELVRRLGRGAVLFVVLNLALGLAIKNVDLADHLGGLAAGFCAGLVLARPLAWRTRPLDALFRALVLGSVGIGAVVATAKLSATPVDLRAEMEKAGEVQDTVRIRYLVAMMRYNAQAMTGADFSRTLDDDIRPMLRDQRDRLRSVGRLRGEQRTWVERTSTNLDLEERSLALLGEAIRTQDPEAFGKAKELMDRAKSDAVAERRVN